MNLAFKPYQNLIEERFNHLKNENFLERLWLKDPSLWKEGEEDQKIIRNSLGWLTVAEFMLEELEEINRFAEEVKNKGFKHLLLLGMGGSSLAVEVCRLILPCKNGYPGLHLLDSTDPDWIQKVESSLQLDKTLFILSSKSGTTIESLSFFSYFYERTKRNGGQFMAITDPNSYLANLAKEKKFLRTFLNPSDIGGRFSALSYFGMVPAALAGMDVSGLIDRAINMMNRCKPEIPLKNNPGVELGILLAEMAKAGRDKVTLILPKKLESFGLWVEQLIAESSGKEGKGIIPIVGESIAESDRYGKDRFFIWLSMGQTEMDWDDPTTGELEERIAFLQKDHPLLRMTIQKPIDLGSEFFRWEIATAVACSILEVNAFNQPHVQSAKELTQSLLNALTTEGSLPTFPTHIQGEKFKATFSQESVKLTTHSQSDPAKLFQNFLNSVKTGDYIGILAYLPFDLELEKRLDRLRSFLRDKTGASTLFGYGPRYLHSTGQLYKGGADRCAFIILTAECKTEIKVPDKSYTFGELEIAQALGDFQALDSKKRRAVWIHLNPPILNSLDELFR